MENLLRSKLKENGKILGTHVSLADTCICDIMGRMGFDYLWIDLEHTALSIEQALVHITITQARGSAALVRVPPDDYVTLKRILEIGPDGIIFPMVESAEHAKKLVDYTLYPPIGNRGFGPRGAIGYGLEDVNRYLEYGSKALCRFVQIETRGAYEDLDGILANPWIDGVIVGPCDLAGQYGSLTDVMAADRLDMIRDISMRAKAAGKRAGLSFGDDSRQTLDTWFSLGVDMLSVAGDTHWLIDGAKRTFSTLQEAAQNDIPTGSCPAGI